jgi:hypothetical protein
MKLEIEPLSALCNERVNIRVSGLPPSGKVRTSASMAFPWAKTVKYESVAEFTADQGGTLDLSTQKPDSGTYGFADSMGLLLSMKRAAGKSKGVFRNISVESSLFIDINVECGQESSSARLERRLVSPGIQSLRVNDTFVGELFYSANADKTIVVLGGSSNDELTTLLPLSALLASHGFNVLALVFFGEKGINSALAEIPLEYFERVFEWLEANPLTRSRQLYVYGGSIGGVLGLLLASRYPAIRKVVAVNPIAWCFQGITFRNVSSWTHGGKPLPYILH